ncbi:MAG: hypothetical protein AAF726_16670 [Planctomycetota bacterium]
MNGRDPEYEERLRRVRTRLVDAQARLREQGETAFAIELGGDDRAGVHRLTKRLFEWMDAHYMDAHVQGRPRGEERKQPSLGRMWRDCPRAGRGTVFVRSAAHNALAERVRGRLKRKRFERELEHIRQLEMMFAREGVKLVKLWLTVSPKEHRRRSESLGDLDHWRQKQMDRALVRDLEDGGEVARAVRSATDHEDAPWHLLDGQNPRERDLIAAEIIATALDEAAEGRTAANDDVDLPPAPADASRRVEELFFPEGLVHEVPDEATYHDRLRRLRAEITERAIESLRDDPATVVVVEGWDASGKGGAIRRALPALDPGFFRVVPTAAPDAVERAYPYLWRFWRDLPLPGHITFFDRSWYGRVLVERVEGSATEAEWKRAYDEIIDFEDQLLEAEMRVVKIWMEVSDEEQLRRFKCREELPEKRHKIAPEHWRNREKRTEYEEAIREAIARTDRPSARWNVIGAENKRAGRLRFLEILRDALG